MNTNLPSDSSPHSRIHPLVAGAAVAVILAGGTGVAAMTGLLPTSRAVTPTTGLGAVGGAVAGGLLGNQVAQGRGRVLATIAGAVGGGLAGNGIEHAVRKDATYQVQVRMQGGSYRNFNYDTQPTVQVGERVRVYGDSLSAS
ncbi:glycine zipper 2TM domain-containing protein [Paraburkholderia sp. Cpub6]|uniref:glycine zipper 2TM domain-containing protein n=1 Tax=Paraburkholderia sp. Cpub6 TaxID=2723094 RepID=UPI00160C14EC|nr:glycine zipper 2TM domain-containing protein [Paraburkholderia sp. Cpub6]MBB5463086.1 outer membrane lipoprotein SlyB [Paraburkholderia sp. Cpub6]